MAYETAAAVADLDTLLDALMDFAAANGFTKISTVTGPGGTYNTDLYILQKGSMYWWFIGNSGTDGEFGAYGMIESRMQKTLPTLANRENVIADSPSVEGQREMTRTFLFDNPNGSYTNYFFFGDSDAIHAVIELSPGIYTHLSFGIIDKAGTWTGGEYLSGSDVEIAGAYSASTGFSWTDTYSNLIFGGANGSNEKTGYLYYPYETQGDERDWSALHSTLSAITEGRRTVAPAKISASSSQINMLLEAGPNTFNDRSMLIPTYLWVYDNRSGGSLRNIPVGTIPNARILNITNISPEAIVETDWVVFPQFQKTGDAFAAPESGLHGVAYKKVL